ncbi:MAG TPA: hypothetical protein VG407_03580 [Caulobacteraceae bacterium]|jgi:hypothetical protein|nr:hypothetical protein [Caulobacteraceae bacterium]
MSDSGSTGSRSPVPTTVNLTPSAQLDLSFLPEAERRQLLADYSKGILDVSKRAQELHVDVGALKATLSVLADTNREVSAGGASVTISHTQTTSTGRTEILIGNTKQAASGRLTKSQTGEADYTWAYVIGGIIALLIVISLFTNHH